MNETQNSFYTFRSSVKTLHVHYLWQVYSKNVLKSPKVSPMQDGYCYFAFLAVTLESIWINFAVHRDVLSNYPFRLD